MIPTFILIALGLIQIVHCQSVGFANCGCNNMAGNGYNSNNFAPNNVAVGPNGLGLAPNGLTLAQNGMAFAPNSCPMAGTVPVGYGDVAVTGELPVGGSTTVAGQVPVIGYVTFEGTIPAGGLVSVANSCGCNGGTF